MNGLVSTPSKVASNALARSAPIRSRPTPVAPVRVRLGIDQACLATLLALPDVVPNGAQNPRSAIVVAQRRMQSRGLLDAAQSVRLAAAVPRRTARTSSKTRRGEPVHGAPEDSAVPPDAAVGQPTGHG